MNLHLSLKIFFATLITLSAFQAQAATAEPPLVEIAVPENTHAPYLERRGTHGLLIGVDYESLVLKNFYSTLDDHTYSEIFGSDAIPFVHLSIDYKYNFFLGALAIGVDAGIGSLTGGNFDHGLDVTKYGGGIKYIADAFMAEPYVAPYVGLNFWTLSTSDKMGDKKLTETTGIGYNYTLGVMIQLDWLDKDTAKISKGYGIENSYLDLYATQYASTGDAGDVDTGTDILWGAGLKFEF